MFYKPHLCFSSNLKRTFYRDVTVELINKKFSFVLYFSLQRHLLIILCLRHLIRKRVNTVLFTTITGAEIQIVL